jgi:hypothetical protein
MNPSDPVTTADLCMWSLELWLSSFPAMEIGLFQWPILWRSLKLEIDYS